MNTKLTTQVSQKEQDPLDLTTYQVKHLTDLVALEHSVLKFWKKKDLVTLVQLKNRSKKKFSFFDGPVTANNPLGVHHAWGRTLKDVVQRHYALKGYDQRFEYGFDTQGLWVEVEVEKALGFNSKKEVEDFGVDRFVEACKQRVQDFSKIQDEQSLRLGLLKSPQSYYTHTDENISAIWTFLNRCNDNGWLYQSSRPMPWCPRCGTSLSAHEQADSYQDLTHKTVYAKFPVTGYENTFLVVWTTTPWTLPANLAVAVHPEKDYGFFETGTGEKLVVGSWLANSLMKDNKLLYTKTGSELTEFSYSTPFVELEVQKRDQYPVLVWTDVSEEEGTGVVHLAPGCGSEDYELLKDNEQNPLSPLDEEGNYAKGYGSFSGMNYQQVNLEVVVELDKKNLLLEAVDYTHRYPHCWRCKTELVYRLVNEWFLNVDELRSELLVAAEKVTWDPTYTKKLFMDWVHNMGDWCVSRKRYWGLPLPFYKCECGYLTVVGSKEQFMKNAVGPVDQVQELHLPWVDLVQYPCKKCNRPTTRVSEVGDCWLDAGVMPFSTLQYFSKDKTMWKEWFPAEFVCEMREQVRLWFYSMMFLSVTLVGKAPFKTVLSYEKVKDKFNQEMHKTGKNNVLLDDALERLGADSLRLYYLSQNRTTDMRFDFEVGEALSRVLLTLYHSFRFFQTYAELEDFVYDPTLWSNNLMDDWMLSRVARVSPEMSLLADDFDFTKVVNTIQVVVNDLSTWYLRRVRERVWNKSADEYDRSVYNTLFRVFHQLAVSFAPFTPFFSEVLYQNLRKYSSKEMELSVHLEDYFHPNSFDMQLEDQMAVVREFDELNRQLRSENGVKLRQPLKNAYLWHNRVSDLPEQLLNVLKETLNVKRVEFLEEPELYVTYNLLPAFDRLGPVYGSKVKEIALLLRNLPEKTRSAAALRKLDKVVVGSYELSREDYEVRMAPKEGYYLMNSTDSLLLLDFELTQDLMEEGFVRDFTRHVQQARKDQGFTVEERVTLLVKTTNKHQTLLDRHKFELTEQLYLYDLQFEDFKSSNSTYTVQHETGTTLFKFKL